MTAQDLIASSLRLIGVLASGETPTAAEINDALLILNQLIDSWNAERMMIFVITMTEFPLTAGKQVYTMGTGGDFNVPRPPRIDRIGIVSLNNPVQPLEIPVEMLDTQQWAEIPVKLIQSTLPLQCYDDGAFPLRNLNFRYIPSIAVNARVYYWTALSSFPDLVTDITFPPAYLRALRYNLAVDLMPEFPGGDPGMLPLVLKTATETKAMIKSINTPFLDMKVDSMLVSPENKRVYNWLTDSPARGRN